MRRDLVSLLLATIAALLWAPLAVVAATPNLLLNPAVAPSSGTTSTTFVLSVDYRSSAGTPAGTVSVAVGGRTMTMTLSQGTTAHGTWSASVRLAAGIWTTTFSASPPKGNKPSILGPSVAVLGIPGPLATATASPSPSPVQSVGAVIEPNPGTSPSLAPAPGATATPAPSAAVAPTGTAASSPAGTGSTATAAPGGGGGIGGSGAGATRASAGPVVGARGALPVSPGPSASTVALGGTGSMQSNATQLSILAIAGAGALGVIAAWFILLGSRRRDDDPAPAAPGVQPGGVRAPRRTARGPQRRAEPDDPPITRRAALRARIQPADDPILRAMGLGPADAGAAPNETPRERRVGSGPGERPARRRSAGTSAADGSSASDGSSAGGGDPGSRRRRSR